MKIDSITLHHLNMPLVAPFETSFGRELDRECIIVSIRSDGLTGYGECVADQSPGYNYETTGTAWHIIKDFIAPLILGRMLRRGGFSRTSLWHTRSSSCQGGRRDGVVGFARQAR